MSNEVNFKVMVEDRQFMKLFFSGIISRFGDAVDMIAYAYMVYELTGSAVLMATLFAVSGVPSLIFNMFSGVFVTYMPKKKVVWTCDFLRGLVVTLTAILYFAGMLEVWHLYLFTVLNSTFEAFRAPAASTLMVLVVPKEKIDYALSLNTSARTFAELIGYTFAAGIVGLIGVSGAILVDGITFFTAGLLILLIVMEKEVLRKETLTVNVYFRDLNEGIQYVLKNPLILTITFFIGGIMFFFSPFNALQMPYVLEVLDLGMTGISVLSVCFMVAMIIGSLMVPSLSKKICFRKLFLLGGIVVGAGYFALGLIQVFAGTVMGYIALGLVAVCMGSTLTFIQVPISITLMKQVDKDLMPRVSSVVGVLGLASVPIGGAIVSVLIRFMAMSTLFYITSIAVIALFISQFFNQSLKAMDEQAEEATIVAESVE